jgi:hypothetical protein
LKTILGDIRKNNVSSHGGRDTLRAAWLQEKRFPFPEGASKAELLQLAIARSTQDRGEAVLLIVFHF